ncbi:MAG: mechanosensitive ion channel [Bacteroidetes bacterium]|nr:mechanosensitive ion channel [Bacteroidota bacterium]
MKNIRLLLIICLCGLAMQFSSHGQSVPIKQSEQKKQLPETIKVSDIPLKSIELMNKTRHAFQTLPPPGTIRMLRARNEIISARIDTNILKPLDQNDPEVKIMSIENRKVLLEQEHTQNAEEEKQLSQIIRTLDEITTWLNKEAVTWKNTRDQLLKDSPARPVPANLTSTIVFIDSSLNFLLRKTSTIIGIMEKNILLGIKIDFALQRTIALISRKELNSLKVDHPSFFSLDFRRSYISAFANSLKTFKELRIKELVIYTGTHKGSVIIVFLLFSVLLWFFYLLKKRTHINLDGYGRFYKEKLMILLSQPLMAALILSLISVEFIFPARPGIFRELVAYLFAYPAISLLKRILKRKHHIYLYSFIIILVLYLFLILASSDAFLSRLMYLLISVAEIALLFMLLINFRKITIKTYVKYLVYIFVVFHLALALTGLIANLTGRLILTSITINAVFINIISVVILIVAAIMANGLVASVIDSRRGRKVNSIRLYGEMLKQRLILILNTLAIFYWLAIFLNAFHLRAIVYDLIVSVITYKFTVGDASFSLDGVLLFFTVIFVSFFLARFLQVLLEKDVLNRLSLSKGMPHTISMGLKYVLVITGFFLAFYATGIPMDKVTIILGAFSVGIGFGLQTIFNNIVSGLILLFERPIQLGDTVQVGPLIGNVKSIDLRASNIRTFDGAEVIVPNGQLISKEVINWTLSDKTRRMEVPLGVAYDSDPHFVQGLVMEILRKHPMILQQPEPVVYFLGVGQFAMDFELLFWISDYSQGRSIKSEVLFGVFKILKDNNIKIPVPRRDITINPPLNNTI